MIAIGSLLVLVATSLAVTRVATLVLVATGLSRTVARFQARSALSGAGFTTSESEQVVGHPLRRRVIMVLMLIGNVGLVASAGTLILGFNHGTVGRLGITAGELVVGLFVLVFLSRNRWVDRRLTRLILRILRRYSRVMRRDLATLVDLGGHHAVCELFVREGDWLAGRTLGSARLDEEGVVVLGVQRPGKEYQATPPASTTVDAGITLIVHGHLEVIEALDGRRGGPDGDAQHESHARRYRLEGAGSAS
ncbi:MAG: potassium transporter TrkA [Actinomycetota bacterium]|nr:potassium transporter TrkA [Actinomycetota bacterium]